MITRFLGNVKGVFNIITILEIVYAFICLLLGIILISNPSINISILISFILMIYGIISCFSFLKRGDIEIFNYNLIYGILFILISVIGFFSNNFYYIIIGIYLILVGVQKVNYSLLFKKYNESSWLLTLTVGIMLIILALISFFSNVDILNMIVGLYLLAFGSFNVILNILFRQRSSSFLV